MKNKVIIFDMDGVLFDTIPFAEEFYLNNHPGMTSEMYKDLHSGNFHEKTLEYSHFQKEETKEEREKRLILYAEKKSERPMFNGIRELLQNLHDKDYLLVLNTGSFNRNCLLLLEKSGIKPLFDLIATAESSKSKVEKFKLIEEKYHANKEDLIFITDSLGDIKEAEIAEIQTIAVTWGVHDQSYFKKEKHSNLIGIVNSVEELSNSINKYYA